MSSQNLGSNSPQINNQNTNTNTPNQQNNGKFRNSSNLHNNYEVAKSSFNNLHNYSSEPKILVDVSNLHNSHLNNNVISPSKIYCIYILHNFSSNFSYLNFINKFNRNIFDYRGKFNKF